MVDRAVHRLIIAEPKLQLGRMDVYVNKGRVHREGKHGKGILMLHHEWLVGILDGLSDEAVADIPPVDEINLKAAVAPGNDRLSDKASHSDRVRAACDGNQVLSNLPPVDGVDNVLQISVAGGKELCLVILNKAEGDFRMGQGNLFHQARHMGGLRGRRLQELPPCRRIKEQVPYQEGCALRGADLLEADFLSAFDAVAASGDTSRRAGNQLHLRNGRNAGKGLTAESQGSDSHQVRRVTDFAGGVAQECGGNLLRLDSASVIGDADDGKAPVPDLHRDGRRFRVDGIFQEFLYHGSRSLDNLSRCNLIDCILVKHMNFGHVLSLPSVLQPVLQPVKLIQRL